MKCSLILACASLALTAPVLAQTIRLDDEGWSSVDPSPASSYTIDIEDDGWSRVDIRTGASDRGLADQRAGVCSQLERSVRMRGDACGTVDRSGLATMIGDD